MIGTAGRRFSRWIAGFATVALVAGATLAAWPARAAVAVTEVALTNVDTVPIGITSGSDGNLWVAEAKANAIARVTTAGTITEFSLANAGSKPMFVTLGSDGNVWFTERIGNRIGRITPAGTITEFALPVAASGPADITAGPDGALWFTESLVDRIGRISTAGIVTEFAVSTPFSGVAGIAAGPDGNLWFTESSAGKVGRITPAGVVTEFALPSSTSAPSGITKGQDNALWVAETDASKIARVSTSGTVTEFSTPTPASSPVGITGAADGTLWFTESAANRVAQMQTSGAGVDLAIPTANAGATAITVGPDGNVWLSETNVGRLGKVAEAGGANGGGGAGGGNGGAGGGGSAPPPTVSVCTSASVAPYTDRAEFDVFAHDIDCVTTFGLAEGFVDGSYGPTLNVSRAEMATFVARLVFLKANVAFPHTLADVFPDDDAGVPHELSIDALGAIGIWDGTTGEQGGSFGVSAPMRRDDMAQVLANAYRVIVGTPLSPSTGAPFTDTVGGGDPHGTGTDNADAINALATAGVVNGKTATTYEPASPVSRAEFAGYFARFLQTLADAGHPPAP